MKDSGPATNAAAQSAKLNQLATVSNRKLRANRENAKKSTGPKTLRGKACSRVNALEHGLFARQFFDFVAVDEDPQEYEELLNGLWEQYQPLGKAEELEVERVALCWWKFKRAWRYENAVNRAAVRDVAQKELAEQEEWCKEQDKEDEAFLLELKSAKKEIEETGGISQDTKQRLFAMRPRFESIWSGIERMTQEKLKEPAVSKVFQKLSPQEHASVLARHTVTTAIDLHEPLAGWRYASAMEISHGSHLVPNREALDKILRYEAAIDRSLSRAVDRLEHLQRCRRGEAVLPPVRVRLTR
jgi:hypothetical protein